MLTDFDSKLNSKADGIKHEQKKEVNKIDGSWVLIMNVTNERIFQLFSGFVNTCTLWRC